MAFAFQVVDDRVNKSTHLNPLDNHKILFLHHLDEYTGAVKPLFRKTGNRQTGKWKP